MARIVVKTEHGPYILKPEDAKAHICMCGLSKNQPFCDNSHTKTLDEKDGKTYVYNEKGEREEMCGDCEDEGHCCCGECDEKK
jgi:CDGSH iron-sulfur domain-containing protein 3